MGYENATQGSGWAIGYDNTTGITGKDLYIHLESVSPDGVKLVVHLKVAKRFRSS